MKFMVASVLIASTLLVNVAWAVDSIIDLPVPEHGGPAACTPADDGSDPRGGHSDPCCHFCHASGHLSGMVPAGLAALSRRDTRHPASGVDESGRSRTWAPPTPPPDA